MLALLVYLVLSLVAQPVLSLVAHPVVYVVCPAPLPAVELLALACRVCPLPPWLRARL